MIRRLWMGLLVLLTFAGAPSARPTPCNANEGTSTPIRLVSSTTRAVVLAFELPDYTLKEASAGGRTFVRVLVSGLPETTEPGAPQLPQASVLLGLPPTGAPKLEILEIAETTVPLAHPILPVPAPQPVRETESSPSYRFVQDRSLYAHDVLFPTNVAAVTKVGWLRDHRLGRVTLSPFRYNPARGELQIVRKLVVSIRFDADDATAKVKGDERGSVFDEALLGAVINGEVAGGWRAESPTQMSASATALNTPATQAGSIKVIVDSDGLYRLTRADLQAAGLPVESLDPHALQLFEGGAEVAIRVTGEEDGILDAGDELLFYGRVPRSRITAHNVYWLRVGEGPGRRMASRNVSPAIETSAIPWTTARWEDNHRYDPLIAAADGDHWFAADLRPAAGHTATLTLMPFASEATTATLRAWLAGYTDSATADPDHHTVFGVNGTRIGEHLWDGRGPVTVTLTLEREFLAEGENTVTVSLPGDTGASVEGVWLDALALDYPFQSVTNDEAIFWRQGEAQRYALSGFSASGIHLYDVTDPQQPVRLMRGIIDGSGPYNLTFADGSGRPSTYLALTSARMRRPAGIAADRPSNLREKTAGADVLIVTPAEFAAAVAPLADHRRTEGLTVFVAPLQDIYDEFSGGLPDPEAIRAFIGHVLPTYALLVGDGSYDFLNHYGYDPVNALPPYLAMVDPWWGETAADNRYAAVVGDDPLPDLLLGRLPVTTAAEAQTVVDKILAYEQTPWLGDWNARHVFVADDADDAGDFGTASNSVYNGYIAEPWVGQKIYLDELVLETARQETLTAWNQGALLMSFTGHSSWHQWAVESLIDIHDVPNLRNGRQWPVLLSMTCFTGFFHHPEYATLDESLLRLEGSGAVATWSPSGLGVGTGHEFLHRGFYEAVFEHNQTELGPAILSAKLNLYSQAPGHVDLLDTYHLFGDPAMNLNLTLRPWPYSTFLPMTSH